MKHCHNVNKFIVRLTLTIALLFNFGCAETKIHSKSPPPNAEYASFPQMVLGDSWIFSGRSEVYGGEGRQTYRSTVVEVKKSGGFVLKVQAEHQNGVFLEYYDDKHRLEKIFDFVKGEEVMQTRSTLSPPTPIKFPLFVGLTWKEDYIARSVLNTAYTLQIRNHFEVEDYEHIEINGKFEKAFRIERTIRPASDSSQIYSQTYWYAPKYKRIVSINSSYTTPIKMLSFSPKYGEELVVKSDAKGSSVSKKNIIIDKIPPIIKIMGLD